jgi:hypothetical protein
MAKQKPSDMALFLDLGAGFVEVEIKTAYPSQEAMEYVSRRTASRAQVRSRAAMAAGDVGGIIRFEAWKSSPTAWAWRDSTMRHPVYGDFKA